jgi:hypothetical protein
MKCSAGGRVAFAVYLIDLRAQRYDISAARREKEDSEIQ